MPLPFGADWTSGRANRLFRYGWRERGHFHHQRGRQRAKTIDFGPERRNLAETFRRRALFDIYVESHRANGCLASRLERNKHKATHNKWKCYGFDNFPTAKRFFISFRIPKAESKRSGEFRSTAKIRSN
jgi:hypothetical protein